MGRDVAPSVGENAENVCYKGFDCGCTYRTATLAGMHLPHLCYDDCDRCHRHACLRGAIIEDAWQTEESVFITESFLLYERPHLRQGFEHLIRQNGLQFYMRPCCSRYAAGPDEIR